MELNLTYTIRNFLKLKKFVEFIKSIGEQHERIFTLVSAIAQKFKLIPNETGMLCKASLNEPCQLCGKCNKHKRNIRVLGCGHRFHKKCIDNWLIHMSLECMVCNANICDHIIDKNSL